MSRRRRKDKGRKAEALPPDFHRVRRAAARRSIFVFIPPPAGRSARWEFLSRRDGRLLLT